MSLLDYYTGQQSWADYVSNRDLARRFESSLSKTGDRLAVQLSSDERNTALVEGLGSLESSLASGNADLLYELQDVSAGIDRLNADFHILMGDVAWRLERQTAALGGILSKLQTPLDTASKELRARAEDAYRNGWYEEALGDFRQSEQKNYQDFAVHRSIGNIYLYHLVDLPKAAEYFQKAAKYARPRDSGQAAEAEFFAGVAYGLQQDYVSALKHMREAISLNCQFYEAYYSSACFASLLGQVNNALDNIERAIHGDARYHEKCRHDPCFDKTRSQIDSLLAQLSNAEREEVNSRVAELRQTIQRLRHVEVADEVVQKYSTQLRGIEDIGKYGDYSALRMAATRAFEVLSALRNDGIRILEEASKRLAGEVERRRSEAAGAARQIEQELAELGREKVSRLGMIGLFILGAGCLYISLAPLYRVRNSPGGLLRSLSTLEVSVPVLLIGGVCAFAAVEWLVTHRNLNSQMRSLLSQASRARDRLRSGRDELLLHLETQLGEVRQCRNELSKMQVKCNGVDQRGSC